MENGRKHSSNLPKIPNPSRHQDDNVNAISLIGSAFRLDLRKLSPLCLPTRLHRRRNQTQPFDFPDRNCSGRTNRAIGLALDSKQAAFKKDQSESVENDPVDVRDGKTRSSPHDDSEARKRHEIRHPKDPQARKNLSEPNGRETSTHIRRRDRQ